MLAKLKKRDSDIYKEDKIFFDDNEVLAGQVAKQNGHAAEAKQRPVLLKDIIARQARPSTENDCEAGYQCTS